MKEKCKKSGKLKGQHCGVWGSCSFFMFVLKFCRRTKRRLQAKYFFAEWKHFWVLFEICHVIRRDRGRAWIPGIRASRRSPARVEWAPAAASAKLDFDGLIRRLVKRSERVPARIPLSPLGANETLNCQRFRLASFVEWTTLEEWETQLFQKRSFNQPPGFPLKKLPSQHMNASPISDTSPFNLSWP